MSKLPKELLAKSKEEMVSYMLLIEEDHKKMRETLIALAMTARKEGFKPVAEVIEKTLISLNIK